MKEDQLKKWNAHRLSKSSGVDYNKLVNAFRYQNSKMITKEEADTIKAEAKKAFKQLCSFLDGGRGL